MIEPSFDEFARDIDHLKIGSGVMTLSELAESPIAIVEIASESRKGNQCVSHRRRQCFGSKPSG